MKFMPIETEVIAKVLQQRAFQLLIGSDEWDLTEDEEVILWKAIKYVEQKRPQPK